MGIEFLFEMNEKVEMNNGDVFTYCECTQRHWILHLKMVKIPNFVMYILLHLQKGQRLSNCMLKKIKTQLYVNYKKKKTLNIKTQTG